MSDRQTFYLPDLGGVLATVSSNDKPNPHHSPLRLKSRAWIEQHGLQLCGPRMRSFLDICEFDLLAAYVHPYAGPETLRASMDFFNMTWIIDEYTDTQDGAGARKAAVIMKRTLTEPEFDDGTWLCHMVKDFLKMYIDLMGKNVARRFIKNFCDSVDNVSKEATHRERNEILNISEYFTLRHQSSGLRPSFDVAEYCLGLDLPLEVYEDPVFKVGYDAAVAVVWLTNNMEQAKGHGASNILTIVMKLKNVDIQRAADFAGGMVEAFAHHWAESKRVLSGRSDPLYSTDGVRMLDALGDWMRGNHEWSFATERYFGKENKAAKETGVVKIKALAKGVVNFTD